MNYLIAVLIVVGLMGCRDGNGLSSLPPDAVILCFGDSLTYGTGAEPGNSYPDELGRLINRPVVNAGIPGETSEDAVKRLPAELDRVNPKLLILCTGANDILRRMDLERTTANLREMVRLARDRGVQVVLIGVPHWGLGLQPTPLYGMIAEELNVPLENKILGKVLAKNALKSDPVHPNSSGYRKIAEAVAALLAKNGGV